MNHPLLSVIVPCYNAEKYLEKCISSIVAQTYLNLEILLINDGSTDNTGAICDTWQERDQRIRVVHKQNEGSSYARKDGVELSSGEYVTFVDADDWIDSDMYSGMMSALLTTNSDIARCNFCHVYENGTIKRNTGEEEKGTIEIMDSKDALLLIFEHKKWYSDMWDKIFKKSLFHNVIFPKGRGLADDFVIQYLFHNASQVVFIKNDYYFYLQRSGSICKPVDIKMKLKNELDHFEAYIERYSFVVQNQEYHAVLPYVTYKTIKHGLELLHNIVAFPQYFTDEIFKLKAKQLRSIPFIHEDKIRWSNKIELTVLRINIRLYKMIRLFFSRVRFIKKNKK